MLKNTLFLAASALALLVAGPAFSESFNTSKFIGIDRDADNMISRQEAASYRGRYFAALDLNADGTVEFEEYVKANKLTNTSGNAVSMPADYKEADTNKDTKLSHEEIQAVGTKRFMLLDKDKDGSVSRAEFVAPGL